MVFVDTSALLAVLDGDDSRHEAAFASWRAMLNDGARLVSSNYIVIECAALVQKRLGMPDLRRLLSEILLPVRVEWVTPDDHAAAQHVMLQADRRSLSWVDCTSFVMMRRLRIRCSFTLDRHFAEQGFDALPLP